MASESATGEGTRGIKDLTFFALFCLLFSSMMGSGVFDIPRNIAHSAGTTAILIGWTVTALGMLSLGTAFVYITRKRPDIQSGIYGYARYGFGQYVGFNVALGYGLNALLGNASYLIYIFATLANFSFFKELKGNSNLISLLGESFLIWIVFFLVLGGIKKASISNILISLIKLIALVIVLTLFVIDFKWGQFRANLFANTNFGSIPTQVKSTMLVTVWDFLGVEAACIYAMRAKNFQDVAKATMFGVSIVLLIDFLISILPFGIMASSQVSSLQIPSAGKVLLAIHYANSAVFIRIAVIISVLGALLAWMMLAANMFYLAAVDKAMPKIIAKTSKKDVPINALIASSVILQIFIIIAYFDNLRYLAMIQLATSLIIIPYMLTAAFALKLIISEKKVDVFSLVKGSIAVIYSIWLVYAGGIKYLLFSTLVYTLGIIFYIIARREQSEPVFANKFEVCLFVILVLGSALSLYSWFFLT